MPFIVQNLSMSSSDQLYVSTVIGSGAPLTIQTNESWALPPSLSLHISMTENRGSFFLLKIALYHPLNAYAYQPPAAYYVEGLQHLMQSADHQFVNRTQQT